MRLSDHERKLLRILHNYVTERKRMPSIGELVTKTGRAPWAVSKTLQALNDKGFIVWHPDRHEELQIVRAWEDPLPSMETPRKNWWEYV